MKVTNWAELDGIENAMYGIEVANPGIVQLSTLQIRKLNDIYVSEIRHANASNYVVSAWLKLFGFDIEFKQAPKVTKRDLHCIDYIEDFGAKWIARDCNGDAWGYANKPKCWDGYWGEDNNRAISHIDDGYLAFIASSDTEPTSIEYIRTLEVLNDSEKH